MGWTRKRPLAALTVLALLGLPQRMEAEAGGSNFRGPQGAVPPSVREPMDLAPPPPPAPLARGVPPIVPQTPPPPPPTGAPTAPALARTVLTFADWPFWYHTSRELFETRPASALTFARTSKLPPSLILPALLATCKPAKDPRTAPLAATALLGLGRAATEEAHVKVLLRALNDPSRRQTSEAAATALGLLRRSSPERAFPAASLDAVRNRLYLTVKNDGLPGRLRALAAMSIGLLGDQPTAGPSMARATTERLFKILTMKHRFPGVPLAIMNAVGLQPPVSWPAQRRKQIREFLLARVNLSGSRVPALDAHAVIALARTGDAEDLPILTALLGEPFLRRVNLRRSVMIALGTLAERGDAALRKKIAVVLVEALALEVDDPTVRNLLTMGLARTAAADAREAGSPTPLTTDVGLLLRGDAADEDSRTSPYSALGLGVIGRALATARDAKALAWRTESANVLHKAVSQTRRSARARGAILLAIGLIGHEKDRRLLLSVVSNRAASPALRAPAARALGLLGTPDAPTVDALEAAIVEGRNERLRQDAAAALGMLGATTTASTLLKEIEKARSPYTRGAATLALGNLGYRASIEALLALLTDSKRALHVRMAACAALGVMADPEARTSLSRATCHTNWRALGSPLASLLDLL